MDIPIQQELAAQEAVVEAAVIFDEMIAEGYTLPPEPEMLEPSESLGKRFNAMIIAEMAE